MMSRYQPPTSSEPDAGIVCLLKARDQKGLSLLLKKYGPRVRRKLRRELGMTVDTGDLDEVLNRAGYLAWRHAESYTVKRGKLGTWFYVIARNAAFALFKSEHPRKGGTVQDLDIASLGGGVALGHGQASLLAAAGENTAEVSAQQQAFVACLWQSIEALPELQQKIIRADLRTGDVADAGDLAERFETSKNSIYVSRSSARKTLRRALERNGYIEGVRTEDPELREEKEHGQEGT